MAREITFKFEGSLKMLRAVEHLLTTNNVDYEISIDRIQKKPLRRSVVHVRDVKIRAVRPFKATLEEV